MVQGKYQMTIKMKIVVPVYNAEAWIKDCLDSISSQQHKNFECVVINDASKDKTGEVIDSLSLDSRFTKIHNTVNQGALYNIVNGFKHLEASKEPESVLMAIDGDDKLASPTSLSVIDKVYTKIPTNLLTYGSYVDSPSGAKGICEAFPEEVIKTRSYRNYSKFVTSHLRTFKSKLWYQIKDEDLIDPRTNKHYSVAWDLAFMMPMLEMAGNRFVFIPQTLYLYNKVNPISDGYIRGKEQWETDQFIRRLPKKDIVDFASNVSEGIEPKKLLTQYRFDLPLKYLYAKSIVENWDTGFYKEMYKEHLRIWNGFKEYDNPNKSSFEAFDNEFKEIIRSIQLKGFDTGISRVPVEESKYILNGAHRVAAAMALNKQIVCREGKNGADGQKDCSWPMFAQMGLSSVYADRVAIEYAKLKSNTFIATLFPSAKGNAKLAFDVLNKHGKVFYYKAVKLDENGPLNLMKEFYTDEEWAGGPHNNYAGYREKAALCFTTENPTYFFLVEFNDIASSVAAKTEIRNVFQLGKHTIHINDTHEQTVRLANVVFNDNSIHYLNKATKNFSIDFKERLNRFKSLVKNNNSDIDDYAITVSSVLAAYGLREAKDLDYIHRNNMPVKDHLIDSHNQYLNSLYQTNADDLILNPLNYFHTMGIKFVSLNVVKALKTRRNETKDQADIKLIESL